MLSPKEITAVSRKASLNSKKNEELRGIGVNVVAGDINGPEDDLVRLLTGADVLISAVTASALPDQIALADAAMKAGVGRFVPCTFATACPPRGVMRLREMVILTTPGIVLRQLLRVLQKEDVLDHVKKIYLPYTVIDVGWWYQISPPRLSSGRIDYAINYPLEQITGDGNTPSARTDVRDIGKYVARIVADSRTLNRSVFAYNEVLTENEVFEILERLSGEKVERKYVCRSPCS